MFTLSRVYSFLVSFFLITQPLGSYAQDEENSWKHNMDLSESFRQKSNFSSAEKLLDEAISQINKISDYKSVPQFNEQQKKDALMLVVLVGAITSDEKRIIDKRKDVFIESLANAPTKERLQKISCLRNFGQEEYQKLDAIIIARYSRLENSFQKLFGSNAPETKWVVFAHQNYMPFSQR